MIGAVRPRVFRCVRRARRPILSRTIPACSVTQPPAACFRGRSYRSASRRGRPSFPAMWQDEGGAVAVVAALVLTALIGVVGLAVDVGMWYRTNRALQNAADAAVIAAALNKTASYRSEAKAVA